MGATYAVDAQRYGRGWELHVADVGVTQCGHIDDAERVARDYLAAVLGGSPGDYEVTVRHEGDAEHRRLVEEAIVRTLEENAGILRKLKEYDEGREVR